MRQAPAGAIKRIFIQFTVKARTGTAAVRKTDKEGHIMNYNPETKMVGEGVKFERIRRITGYLVGTVDRFNDGKRAEERDRVKHSAINNSTK